MTPSTIPKEPNGPTGEVMWRQGEVRRAEILAYVRSCQDELGFQPSLREIGNHLGISVTTVHKHVRVLQAQGELFKKPRDPRSLLITGATPKEDAEG